MWLPLFVREDEERRCFSCHLMNRMNLMVGDKKIRCQHTRLWH